MFSASSPATGAVKWTYGGFHSNSAGYVVKRTPEGSYGWLYVLDGGDSEYLLKKCLAERRSVTLRDADKLGAVAESG